MEYIHIYVFVFIYSLCVTFYMGYVIDKLVKEKESLANRILELEELTKEKESLANKISELVDSYYNSTKI